MSSERISKRMILSFTLLINFILGLSFIWDQYWKFIDPAGAFAVPELLIWMWLLQFVIVLDIAVFFLIERLPKGVAFLTNTTFALIYIVAISLGLGVVFGSDIQSILVAGLTPILISVIDILNGWIANGVAEQKKRPRY